MTALTTARPTKERAVLDLVFPVDAGVKIFGGGLVAFTALGNARPAGNATVLRCLGVAQETVDNTAGVAGALSVRVRRSCFQFFTTDVTAADLGKDCWAVDDQTVTKTLPGASPCKAGVIVGVEVGTVTTVWVDTAA